MGLDSEAKKLGRHRGQSSYNNIQYQTDEKNAGKETYGEVKAKRGIVHVFPGMVTSALILYNKKHGSRATYFAKSWNTDRRRYIGASLVLFKINIK
jgi:hypothetical protein